MLFLLFISFISLLFTQEKDIPTDLLEQQMKLERYVTEWVQTNIVDKILGEGKAVTVVKLELGIETTRRGAGAAESAAEAKRGLGEIQWLLPGVPLPRSLTHPTVPTGETKQSMAEERKLEVEVKTVLRKKSVTVLHDELIPKVKIEALRKAITAALALREPPHGPDELKFEKTKFSTPIVSSALLRGLIQPRYILLLLLSLLLMLFLFGPVASFLRNYLKFLRERGATEITVDSKLESTRSAGAEGAPEEGGLPGGPGGAGAFGAAKMEELKKEEEEIEEEKRYKPFTYIDEDNLRKLIYLIRKEPPTTIVTILSYLKPEFVREIISSLPPALQVQVALNLGMVREITLEELMALDEEIKTKIGLIVGDPMELIRVLEEVDEVTRHNILEYLKNENPELYNAIKKRIIIFEDIVNYPDIAVQMIIRELKIETLARVLRTAPTEVINKILSNMSSGAATILKEEMEYGRPVSPEEILEERKKIVDVIKKLEAEGKIFIREKTKAAIMEGIEEKTTDFQTYFQTAVSLYEQGNYTEALEYFNYLTEINPDSPEVYQYIGNIFYSTGDIQEAIRNYEKALELNPENEGLKAWLEELKVSTPI